MSVFASTPEKGYDNSRTDPRPRNMLAAIDSEGTHHVYQTRFERVVVVDPSEGIVHVRELDDITIHDWVDAVEQQYDLAEKRMYRDASAALVGELEGIMGGGA